MQGTASPARRQSRPSSLMVRLAGVASGDLPGARRERGAGPRRAARAPGMSACFGLGALASVAIGGVTFLGLQALAASESRLRAETGAEPAAPGKGTAVASWRQPQVFDIAIARSESAHARLGLHVAGGDGGAFGDIEIVLRGVPATAMLTRGERRDAVTWVLRGADLDDLHLSLGDASPEAFDVRIDVVAPPGVPTIGSIARIRVVDAAGPEKGTATAAEGPERRVGRGGRQQHRQVGAGAGCGRHSNRRGEGEACSGRAADGGRGRGGCSGAAGRGVGAAMAGGRQCAGRHLARGGAAGVVDHAGALLVAIPGAGGDAVTAVAVQVFPSGFRSAGNPASGLGVPRVET
jgi:hypothetical protein